MTGEKSSFLASYHSGIVSPNGLASRPMVGIHRLLQLTDGSPLVDRKADLARLSAVAELLELP
jgi:hypothetical protein